MFTSTSGTTSQPKLIPVTRAGRQAERRVSEAWIAQLCAGDHPSILDGRWFYLFNRAEEDRTPAGLWVGSNAGLVYRNMPRAAALVAGRALRGLPDRRLRKPLLRHPAPSAGLRPEPAGLHQPVEHPAAGRAGPAARRGADPRHLPAAACATAWPCRPSSTPSSAPGCRPTRRARRALARLLAAEGRLLPTAVLAATAGARLLEGAGRRRLHRPSAAPGTATCPIRDVGYGSSEFRTGLVLDDDGSRNLPLADTYFYEFIPADDPDPYLAGERPPLLLHELEAGRRYLIVQTGPHGLYRYDIEDIVEVNGFHRPHADDPLRPEGAHGHLDHRREALRVAGDRGDGPRGDRRPPGPAARVLPLPGRRRGGQLQAVRRVRRAAPARPSWRDLAAAASRRRWARSTSSTRTSGPRCACGRRRSTSSSRAAPSA